MRKIITLVALVVVLGGFWHGAAPSVVAFTASQRSIINMYVVDEGTSSYEYKLIDHIAEGGSASGIYPISAGTYASPGFWWTIGNPTWTTGASNANLDAKGWPQNYALVQTNIGGGFGNHIYVPSSTDYNAYTIQWSGDCQVTFAAAGHGSATMTWSNVTKISGTNFVNNSNGNWQGTDVKLTATLTNTGKQDLAWRIISTGQYTGAYCHDLHFYRQSDQADFDAGLIFRSGYKQLLVTQDPAAIRFMNWVNNNGNQWPYRWEHRPPYPYATYGGAYSAVGLAYADTSLCSATPNTFCLSGVTGTPVSMQHGEMVTARLGASMTQSQAGGYAISTINKCATGVAPCNTTGQVVTSGSHPFSVGDPVIFITNSSTGMKEINNFNTTVTAVQDATHFSTGIDTTGFTNFTSGSVSPFVTLNVGARGAYPVVDPTTTQPAASFGSSNYFHANDIRTFFFDKTVFASRDGSGNPVAGVWVTGEAQNTTPQVYPPTLGSPYELAATLIKELNLMSPAHPIDAYINFPATSLLSIDPDYSSGSNYATNALAAVRGIIPTRQIFPELSNEIWHQFSESFPASVYYENQAYYRKGQALGSTGLAYMTGLRNVVMVNDIGTDAHVHPVLGLQGAVGISLSSGQPNWGKAFGGPLYYSDSVIQALPTVAKTGNTHTSTTIDSIAATTGLYQGWGVACSVCQTGTQISSVAANSIVLTLATTGSSNGVALTLTPPPIYYMWAANFASYFDPPTSHTASFTGSIAGTTLTVSAFGSGSPIAVNDFISDGNSGGAGNVSINPNTIITGSAGYNSGACSPACTGTGQNAGTYAVSVSQTVASRAMTKAQYMAYTKGTGTFTDDSALYNGGNNSANGGGDYTGVANTTQAIANFTSQMVQPSSTADSQSVALYVSLASQYSAAFDPIGKYTIGYEGGEEVVKTQGATYGSHVLTLGDSTFLLAWQASASWSTAWQNYLTSFRSNNSMAMPAAYLMINCEWGFTPSTCTGTSPIPDSYSGGVEGGALSTTWTTNGTVNQALPN